MDTLIIMALIAIAVIAVAVIFFVTVNGNSGGNDNVWKPGDRKGPNPEG